MDIRVTYRRTSRLSMRLLKNGTLSISTPVGTPRSTIVNFLEQNRSWIDKARQSHAAQQQARKNFFEQLPLHTKSEWTEALNKLQELIRPMLIRYSREMGVAPSRIIYKATISRWGCCQVRTREICFSIYLLLLPEWCIEHVVVHELAHLLVPNHSAKFHAVMDRYFPRWREARAETKRICLMNHAED